MVEAKPGLRSYGVFWMNPERVTIRFVFLMMIPGSRRHIFMVFP
jgi:hypothetical protein